LCFTARARCTAELHTQLTVTLSRTRTRQLQAATTISSLLPQPKYVAHTHTHTHTHIHTPHTPHTHARTHVCHPCCCFGLVWYFSARVSALGKQLTHSRARLHHRCYTHPRCSAGTPEAQRRCRPCKSLLWERQPTCRPTSECPCFDAFTATALSQSVPTAPAPETLCDSLTAHQPRCTHARAHTHTHTHTKTSLRSHCTCVCLHAHRLTNKVYRVEDRRGCRQGRVAFPVAARAEKEAGRGEACVCRGHGGSDGGTGPSTTCSSGLPCCVRSVWNVIY
jgi:hypothetical protein